MSRLAAQPVRAGQVPHQGEADFQTFQGRGVPHILREERLDLLEDPFQGLGAVQFEFRGARGRQVISGCTMSGAPFMPGDAIRDCHLPGTVKLHAILIDRNQRNFSGILR